MADYTIEKLKDADGNNFAFRDPTKASSSHTHSVKINGSTKTIPPSGGTPVDLGTYLTSHQDISVKADKVSGATANHFAGLNASGNLIDSGKKAADFATAAQGAKADTAYGWGNHSNAGYLTEANLNGYHKDYPYCKRIVLNVPENNGVAIQFPAPSSSLRLVQFFIRYGKASSAVELNVGMIVSSTEVTSCVASILTNVGPTSTNVPTDVQYNFQNGIVSLFFKDSSTSNKKVVEIVATSDDDVDYTTLSVGAAVEWTKVSLKAFPRIDFDTLLSGGGIGSSTQPVYVNPSGQVAACGIGMYIRNGSTHSLTAETAEAYDRFVIKKTGTGNNYLNWDCALMVEHKPYHVSCSLAISGSTNYTGLRLYTSNTSKASKYYDFKSASSSFTNLPTSAGANTRQGCENVMLVRDGVNVYLAGY